MRWSISLCSGRAGELHQPGLDLQTRATRRGRRTTHSIPAGRVGVPEDIAALVAFLVGADSGFITGAEFIVDGGVTRKMIYPE